MHVGVRIRNWAASNNWPVQVFLMVKLLNKVCGVDVHTLFIDCTILERGGCEDGTYRKFGTDIDSLLEFRDWVVSNGCERVAFESTGVYWLPVYDVLEGRVEVYLGNAYHIKHINGKKTDEGDSHWVAQLCLADLIKPSRIFPREERSVRTLTRLRASIVEDKTRCKNRMHKALQSCHIKLAAALKDIFGKSGRIILNGLVNGEPDEVILARLPEKMQGKKEELRQILRNTLDPASLLMIKECLIILEVLEEKIQRIEAEILEMLKHRKADLEILMSIPGISYVGAYTILGELGDYKDFETGDKLACWAGLTPSVYQSADKLITGRITKQGSRMLRWIMTEVAQAAARAKNTRLQAFFRRVKSKKGYKTAVIALARKMLCIIYHLLVNREKYVEADYTKKPRSFKRPATQILSNEEMIQILKEADYIVYKKKPRGCT